MAKLPSQNKQENEEEGGKKEKQKQVNQTNTNRPPPSAASLRIYYESTHTPPTTSNTTTTPATTRLRTGEWIPAVPIGYSHQPRELRIVPSTWYRKLGPLVFDRHNDSGGHFWAWEKPESVVRDLRDMFRRRPEVADGGEGVGGAFGVVKGREGFV